MRLRRLAHRVLFQVPRTISKLPRRTPPARSLWTGPAIHTLAGKAEAQTLAGTPADSLVLDRYSTRADFTYDLTRWSAIPLVGKVLPYFVLGWALRRYRQFHVFYNRGVLPQIERGRFNRDELLLMRRRGVEVYFWAYGADVRTRMATLELDEPNCCQVCPAVGELCVCDDRTGAENVAFIRRHASGLATMGDMSRYTPSADADVFYWPVDLDADGGHRFRVGTGHDGDDIVVAHAPNNPALKGTVHLEEAVEKLRSEGRRVRLDLVTGVSNDEVLDRFRDADIVFDQCMIGFHGYTTLEAMGLSKPVLCFLRDPESDLADPETSPIVNITPATLTDELRRLCDDAGRRRRLGVAGRDYVRRHHSPEAVGARIQAFIERSRTT